MTFASISILVSVAALAISILTLWLSQFRRGRIVMSQPTIFFFGWDRGDVDLPKIFLRTALICTAKRGTVLENIYLKVHRDSDDFFFSFWGHDDGTGLTRGSGLFIGDNGFIGNHHFNPSEEFGKFSYSKGEYVIEVFAKELGAREAKLLGRYNFSIDEGLAKLLLPESNTGLIWDWLPYRKAFAPVISPRWKSRKTLGEAS